ncbi:YrhK family protein [Halobacillus sp. Marseille-P3879]|uniref:YrhK family protein n=1 Tax=Halobacillus sp. Marseille-P3879 TaxID=2045014 RepID=UPI000C7A1075|nr:YrhK family protein [Halobacillus sp. Marseille-P3879]
MPKLAEDKNYLDLKAGRFRVFFWKRYKFISLFNDVLVGVFFITGSSLNFFSITALWGNLCYLLGSLFLGTRPVLKFIHDTTLKNEAKKAYSREGY